MLIRLFIMGLVLSAAGGVYAANMDDYATPDSWSKNITANGVKASSVAVLINGEKVAAHFRGSSKPPYTFKISPNQIQDGLVDITFAIKDAISPNALGISEDTRQIAFRVKSLKITKVD